MNSSPSPHAQAPSPAPKPEDENADPVGDPKSNQVPDDEDDGIPTGNDSNSGAERTGNDGNNGSEGAPDVEPDAPKELPEGSDVPTGGVVQSQPGSNQTPQSRRAPIADADLPQCARG